MAKSKKRAKTAQEVLDQQGFIVLAYLTIDHVQIYDSQGFIAAEETNGPLSAFEGMRFPIVGKATTAEWLAQCAFWDVPLGLSPIDEYRKIIAE